MEPKEEQGPNLKLSETRLEEMVRKAVREELASSKSTSEAVMADADAKLAEVATLKEEVARLESQEHKDEVVAAWLEQDFENADPAVKLVLGRKLGLDKLFEEARLAEEKAAVAVAKVEEVKTAEATEPAPKPEVVYSDPKDADYYQVKDMPIWVKKETV